VPSIYAFPCPVGVNQTILQWHAYAVTAEYFDQWYIDIAASEARQRLFTHWLDLPPEIGPSNLVPFSGLREIADALAVPENGLLIDVACGRGGPGMWIARRAQARLIGVDFSPEAVAQASKRRCLFGLESHATFQVGSLEAPGLTENSADAVMCIDAFQFAADGTESASRLRQLLRPGGRIVLTSWEAKDRDDESVPERLRRADLSASLAGAGFREVTKREREDWHTVTLQLWEHAVTLDPAGDPAIESTQAEAVRSIEIHDRVRRVVATAVAP